jgi:hypothetical protein
MLRQDRRGEPLPGSFRSAAGRISRAVSLEWILLLGFLVSIPFLLFYNLEYSPRPWHDEGAALSVSQTLAEDGVYAVRTSEGYQTFGPIQSLGPTVLLPVAISFRFNGIGIMQGRIVAVGYLLLTLLVFYLLGRNLFGWKTAFVAIVLLVGSQAARLLFHGRQVLGEVPALGFLLGAWLVWLHGVRTGRRWLFMAAGLLLGAAIVTKSSYLPIMFGAFGLLAILDLFYYRQGNIGALVITGLVAVACVASWWGWQMAYFGMGTFQENAAKLSQLTNSTAGFDLRGSAVALKGLVGPDWGHFYHLWGFPALLYAGLLCLRRSQEGFVLASLLIMSILWLAYYLVWGVTWLAYVFAPAAISALFVSKLWHDLSDGFTISWRDLWTELRQNKPGQAALRFGILTVMSLVVCYQLQGILRQDVLARDRTPQQVAAFLNETVDKSSVIDTWERELAILTDHQYHFPDQSLLAFSHAAIYRGEMGDYALKADYFSSHRPSYVVVGWFARWTGIYDISFLAEHGTLLSTIGDYQVYELHLESPNQQSP